MAQATGQQCAAVVKNMGLNMFWLKRCPRCEGDLYEDSDIYGHYIACVQCGYYLTRAEEVVLRYSQWGGSRERLEVAAKQETA